MINIPLPLVEAALRTHLTELQRRVVDGTIKPLFVDYNNQRVLVGAVEATTSNTGKLEVTGNIKIVGASQGIYLADTGGTYHFLVLDADGKLPSSMIPTQTLDPSPTDALLVGMLF